MGRDWTGNGTSVYAVLGASSHSADVRAQDDYYATDPKAMELLLAEEAFDSHVWECACGEGHLSEVLEKHGYDVKVQTPLGQTRLNEFWKNMGMM